MADFSVKTMNLKCVDNQFNDVVNELENIWEIVDKVNRTSSFGTFLGFTWIREGIRNSCENISVCREMTCQMRAALAEITEEYEKTERNILDNGSLPLTNKEIDEEGKNLSGIEGIKDRIREWLKQEPSSETEDEFKKWLKILFKSTGTDGEGLIGPSLRYMDDMRDFLDWWINGEGDPASGWSNVCDLSETSSTLWDSFYQYFSSKDGTGVFRDQWGDKVAFVNIFGSLIGMAGDAIRAVSDDTNDVWKKWSNMVDVLKGAVTVEGNVAKYEAISTKADTGPIKLWTTLANTILSTVSQTFDSISEYSADGKWDTHDTAATMMESSISGLDALISGTISFFTLGLMDLDTFRSIFNIPTAKEASEMLEHWSDEKGKEIGNYILQNEELAKNMRNGNPFQKAAGYTTAAFGVHMDNTMARSYGNRMAENRYREMNKLLH